MVAIDFGQESKVMRNYDDEYFFIEEVEDERLPALLPDSNTEDRTFRFEAQPVGSPPLVFRNGAHDVQRRRRLSPLRPVPDVLFSGANLVVRTKIRDALLGINVPHLSMHPTVYIDEDNKWHEDFWYMTFTQTFDCWDRKSSDYKATPLTVGGAKLYSVYSYRLDADVLDQVPLEQRLLFKMGGTQDGYIVCHTTMTKHFSSALSKSLVFTRISDY